jgi:hypothetical protein
LRKILGKNTKERGYLWKRELKIRGSSYYIQNERETKQQVGMIACFSLSFAA